MWLSSFDEAHLEFSPFVVSLHATVRLELFHLPLPFFWNGTGLQSLRVQGSAYFKGFLAQLPHELPSYYKFLANYFVHRGREVTYKYRNIGGDTSAILYLYL